MAKGVAAALISVYSTESFQSRRNIGVLFFYDGKLRLRKVFEENTSDFFRVYNLYMINKKSRVKKSTVIAYLTP